VITAHAEFDLAARERIKRFRQLARQMRRRVSRPIFRYSQGRSRRRRLVPLSKLSKGFRVADRGVAVSFRVAASFSTEAPDPAKDARLTKVLVDLDADLFGSARSSSTIAVGAHQRQDFEGGKHVKVEIGFAPGCQGMRAR